MGFQLPNTKHGLKARVTLALLVLFACSARGAETTVNWLSKNPPPTTQGVAWGVPWPKGQAQMRSQYSLQTKDGRNVPMQTWPLAFWPDGSVKWSGHAISATADLVGPFTISANNAPAAGGRGARGGGGGAGGNGPMVTQDGWKIDIDTGVISARILKHDTAHIFEAMWRGTRQVAQNARLVVIDEDRSQEKDGITKTEDYVSRIDKVTFEQSGNVRAVIKIEGTHVSKSGKTLLPFVVRLYFYNGSDQVQIVHSFVYDGDDEKDFIKGIGLEFDVPLHEEVQNRHVRFAGDTGIWAEPVKPLVGRRVVSYDGSTNIFPDQLAGKRVPNHDEFDRTNQGYIEDAADWSDYRLTQLHPNGYTIEKRTQDKSSWLHSTDGHRAMGLAFVGEVSGGVAVGVKDFWQKYPASFEINNARSDMATMKVWLWSPSAGAMDLRPYDIRPHGLAMGYEDNEPGFNTPYGVANTSELSIWPTADVPSNATLVNMVKDRAEPALLTCAPEYYHSLRSFGYWSLPDTSTPARKSREDELNNAMVYFKGQVDERDWYGLWNYGDMMRMYDEVRNQWKYDIGGWAWNNTELVPNLWLWYSYLRSGREDIFRLAAAMTRQSQEVDVYHIGRFAGLGSRHNVQHWGDGAKQPRISNASLKNIYYYLTTDERVGDLMHEVINSDFAMAKTDPLRNTRPVSEHGVRSGFGFESTWPAFAINWMTEWERTRDTKWRDKIIVGMKSMLEQAPPGQPLLLEGGYDPETGKLYDEGAGGGVIAPLFGGPEICFQLQQMIDYPEFWDAWLKVAGSQGSSAVLRSYAAMMTKQPQLAQNVWGGRGRGNDNADAQPPAAGDDAARGAAARGGRGGRGGGGGARGAEASVPQGGRYTALPTKLEGPDYPNAVDVVPGRPETAGDGHRLLELIELLDLAGDQLPKQ